MMEKKQDYRYRNKTRRKKQKIEETTQQELDAVREGEKSLVIRPTIAANTPVEEWKQCSFSHKRKADP